MEVCGAVKLIFYFFNVFLHKGTLVNMFLVWGVEEAMEVQEEAVI